MAFLTEAANRGSISTGYDIDNSCKFEDDNDEYLYRTNASGTNTKTWTVSWWFKQTELGSVRSSYLEHWQGGVYGEATRAGIDQYDRLWIDVGGGDGNTGTLFRSLSTARLRDTSAWYHVVIACDSTQSTEADRLKVWLNGVEVTSWDQHQIPTLNFASALAAYGGIQMKWGSYDSTYHGYSGYLAECNYVDGVTATQNDFGEFDDDSGIWKPKEYTGSYGTNGSYLDFEIASDLGANAKGNDVNFSLNNITSADQATDTPTNNFATINTLQGNSSKLTITNGATSIVKSGNYGWQTTAANIAVTVGKWYAEFKLDTSCTTVMLGVNQADNEGAWNGSHIGVYSNSIAQGMGYYSQNGYFYRNGGSGAIANTYTAGDIIGIAFCYNSDGTAFMGMSKNGSWQNSQDPSSGTTNMLGLNYGNSLPANTPYTFAISTHESAGGVLANFGGLPGFTISSANTDADGYGSFEYAVPTGYYALCTKNLAEYG